MENKEYIVCECCGKIIDDGENTLETVDGIVCEDCREDYIICDICGKAHHYESMTSTSDNREVCGECLRMFYKQCWNCGEWVHNWDAYFSDVYEHWYCCDCFHDYHEWCECCETYVCPDDYDYDNDCCVNCSDSRIIGGYHSHCYMFVGESDVDTCDYYKGIELEIDRAPHWTSNIELATALNNEFNSDMHHIYFERDGSLSNGFEIITHPHTFKEFYSLDWEKLLTMCKDAGYRSHDAHTCGLHIHYSREFFGRDMTEQDYNIGKIIALYERNYDDFVKLSRRTLSQIDDWCGGYYTNGDCELCEQIAKDKNAGRYHAINLEKYSTIEFRMGRGTLNYKSFITWNKLHDIIIRNVKNVTYADIDNLNVWFDGIPADILAELKEKNVFTSLYN